MGGEVGRNWGDQRRRNLIRIFCMRKESIFNKRGRGKKISVKCCAREESQERTGFQPRLKSLV